ncbi:angiogenin-3-like [Eublepharis macularius]|uniref:Angiogenin-3-like n=1 Tax=Eublepharis macularius TaxID=481883 RepID=A0AA97K6I6_EUBMA|nr:angiogenin-3-like [Eublepharis macularius]
MPAFQGPALIILAFQAIVSGWDNSPESKTGFLLFLKQHFIPDFVPLEALDCNFLMASGSFTSGECKKVNTYIVSFPDILQAVCGAKGMPYNHLRRSLNRFDLVTCTLEGDPTSKPCIYNQHSFSASIAVSCDKYGYPVHLEEGDFQIVTEGESKTSLAWYNYFL